MNHFKKHFTGKRLYVFGYVLVIGASIATISQLTISMSRIEEKLAQAKRDLRDNSLKSIDLGKFKTEYEINALLNSVKKMVKVGVYSKAPAGLNLNFDDKLYKSLIESRLRKDGFQIMGDSDSSIGAVLIDLTINSLKIDNRTFCYSVELRAISYFNPMFDELIEREQYEESIIGFATIDSDFREGIKEFINDHSITLSNELYKRNKLK
jgi:hypothetical protein